MDLTGIERWLLPLDLERNPRFQEELFLARRTGLRMLGLMEVAIAGFLLHSRGVRGVRLLIGTIGLGTILCVSARGVRRHMRAITLLSGWVVAVALIETALWSAPAELLEGQLPQAALSLLVFAVITAAPLVPLQTCVFGSAVGVVYGITAPLAGHWDSSLQTFILFLTCFATWASGVLYAQKRAAFEAHQRSLEIQETLSTAQSRAQLAETAMSLGRLAAALTHEINTPLGALKSSVDTMLLLNERQAAAVGESRERLVQAQADISRSITGSVERLGSVVARLKRLVALERDEKQKVNINDVLTDAALMVSDRIPPDVRIAWTLTDVPPVLCSTNQLTTVFSNLLTNAVSAVDGQGEVEIATVGRNGLVEITVRDNGRGMDAEDLATIFDPGFKVEHGRVLGGNWSLFTARQIVNEHGGEIWIESQRGQGTTAHVELPALREA